MFCRFRFESEIYREMSRLPIHLRMKLDVTGIKLSLKDWLAFSLEERRLLCEAPVEPEQERARFVAAVASLMKTRTGIESTRISPPVDTAWEDPNKIPPVVLDRSVVGELPVAPTEWAQWSPCQRYALVKFAVSKNEPETFYEALREFRREVASRLSAVVLAGGKSTRFGQDKADMELAGRRVVDALVDKLRPFPFQRLALVRARGQGGPLPDEVDSLVDDRDGLGPLGGILTALMHLPGDVLVTACDMPLVTEALIEWLLNQYDSTSDAVIPCHPGGMEPLLGIYAKRLVPRMKDAVHSGRLALHSLLGQGPVRFVQVPPQFVIEREFANINTLKDYQRIVAMVAGQK